MTSNPNEEYSTPQGPPIQKCIQCQSTSYTTYIPLECSHKVCPKCLMFLLQLNSFKGLITHDQIYIVCNCSPKKNSVSFEALEILFADAYGVELDLKDQKEKFKLLKDYFLEKLRQDYSIKKQILSESIKQLTEIQKEHKEKYDKFQKKVYRLLNLMKYVMCFNKKCDIEKVDFISKEKQQYNQLTTILNGIKKKKNELKVNVEVKGDFDKNYEMKIKYANDCYEIYTGLLKNNSRSKAQLLRDTNNLSGNNTEIQGMNLKLLKIYEKITLEMKKDMKTVVPNENNIEIISQVEISNTDHTKKILSIEQFEYQIIKQLPNMDNNNITNANNYALYSESLNQFEYTPQYKLINKQLIKDTFNLSIISTKSSTNQQLSHSNPSFNNKEIAQDNNLFSRNSKKSHIIENSDSLSKFSLKSTNKDKQNAPTISPNPKPKSKPKQIVTSLKQPPLSQRDSNQTENVISLMQVQPSSNDNKNSSIDNQITPPRVILPKSLKNISQSDLIPNNNDKLKTKSFSKSKKIPNTNNNKSITNEAPNSKRNENQSSSPNPKESFKYRHAHMRMRSCETAPNYQGEPLENVPQFEIKLIKNEDKATKPKKTKRTVDLEKVLAPKPNEKLNNLYKNTIAKQVRDKYDKIMKEDNNKALNINEQKTSGVKNKPKFTKTNPAKTLRYSTALNVKPQTDNIITSLNGKGIKSISQIKTNAIAVCNYSSPDIQIYSFDLFTTPLFELKGHSQQVNIVIPLSKVKLNINKNKKSNKHSDTSDNLIASASNDSIIIIWNINTQKPICFLTDISKCEINSLLQIDSETLASSSFWSIKIWDLPSSSEKYSFVGHSRDITSIIQINKSLLVSSSLDGSVKLWDFDTREEILTLYGSDSINNLVHLPKSKFAFTGDDNSIVIFNAVIRQELFALKNIGEIILDLSYFENKLMAICNSNIVMIWDCAKFEEMKKIDMTPYVNEFTFLNCVIKGTKNEIKEKDVLFGMDDGIILKYTKINLSK